LRMFTEYGFRRAQVSDIAKAAGVAQGTLYLYAPSKEALFWIALQRALGEELEGVPHEQELLERVAEKLNLSSRLPSMFLHEQGRSASLEQVIAEVYDALETYAGAIRLVERCAHDWPELAAMFYADRRPLMLKRIADYLSYGAEHGTLRKVPDIPLAARLILETIAWFAIHRQGDADGRFYDRDAAKGAVIDALFHAYSAPSNAQRKTKK